MLTSFFAKNVRVVWFLPPQNVEGKQTMLTYLEGASYCGVGILSGGELRGGLTGIVEANTGPRICVVTSTFSLLCVLVVSRGPL